MAVESKQSEIHDLKSELLYLFIKNNMYEQRLRNYSTRFYNLKTGGMANMDILFFVYQQFILPAYEMARADRCMEQIPPFLATLDVGHPLPTRGEGLCPPITFRFTTRTLKDIFVKYSKTSLGYFNKSNGLRGNSKVTCGRDLTEHNRSTLARLYDHPEVFRGWLAGHTIKYKKFKTGTELPDDKIYTVKNPFGVSLQQMSCEVPAPRWCILYRSKNPRKVEIEEEEGGEQGLNNNNQNNNPYRILPQDVEGEEGGGGRGESFAEVAHRSRSRKPSQPHSKRLSNSNDRRCNSSNKGQQKTQWPSGGAAGSDREGYGIPNGMARGQGYGRGHGNSSPRGRFGHGQRARGQLYGYHSNNYNGGF